MRLARVAACLVTVGVVGCGSSASTPVGPSSTPPGGSGSTVQVGPNGGTSFVPATVDVNVGDTVTWQWQSGPHTVTSGTPGNADGKFCSMSGTPSASACNSASYATSPPFTYSHKFDTAGTYPYFCEVHGAMMTGTVVVGAGAGGSGGSGGGGSGGSGGGGSGGSGGGGGY